MKEILSLLLSFSLLTFATQPARGQEPPHAQVGASAAQLTRLHGGRLVSTYRHALRGFSAQMNPQAAEALSRNPLVEYVEEDMAVELASIQQSAPWGLDRID